MTHFASNFSSCLNSTILCAIDSHHDEYQDCVDEHIAIGS